MVRTPPATLQKIYNLPEFSSTLEFLTMLALSGGRLLKVNSRRHETCSKKKSLNFSIYLRLGWNSGSKFISSSGS